MEIACEPARSWAGLPLTRPLIMGILNVTPDSFSGGHASDPVSAAHDLLAAGADIIDIGGESTRPGAEPVDPDAEIARILPIIRALSPTGTIISVDTRNAATMARALDAGAHIINDVSGLRHDPAAASLIADRGCPIILMHMRGTPQTMNRAATYHDLVAEIIAELAQTRDTALQAGIDPAHIALDPGFGFAKIGDQNVTLLQSLDRFASLGHPLLVGLSRKGFIGALAHEPDPRQRDAASIAAALFAARHGAAILRVHDVRGTVQALRVWRALETA